MSSPVHIHAGTRENKCKRPGGRNSIIKKNGLLKKVIMISHRVFSVKCPEQELWIRGTFLGIEPKKVSIS